MKNLLFYLFFIIASIVVLALIDELDFAPIVLFSVLSLWLVKSFYHLLDLIWFMKKLTKENKEG